MVVNSDIKNTLLWDREIQWKARKVCLSLTAGRKLPKSVRAILLSAEGPASEYWPPVYPGDPDLGLCRGEKEV